MSKFARFALAAAVTAAFISAIVFFAAFRGERFKAAEADQLNVAPPPQQQQQTTQLTKEQISEAYGKIEINFEQNRGQTDDAVDFLARGAGYSLFLKPGEAVFSLSRQSENEKSKENVSDELSKGGENVKRKSSSSSTLRMEIVGANKAAKAKAEQQLEGKVNYFTGNDSRKWLTDVPTFGKVRYEEVYPGVDLVYYGNQRQLEYDFVVAPGADYRQAAIKFEGADKVEVEKETGDLLLRVGKETVRQQKPIVYQETADGRREVESRYLLRENRQVGFEVGEYDARLPLVIDPVLVYSTYLGGNNGDLGLGIAVDSAGNAYVTGYTGSTNFPTANAIQSAKGSDGFDAFVTKIADATADLSITKTDSPDPVSAGSNITYTITVTNNGPDAATGVTLNDVIPANTTFVSVTAPAGFTCPVTPPAGGTGTVTCTGTTLANTASAVFTLVVNVNQGATGIISNTATVASSAADTNTDNNSDTETTSIASEADLALSMIVSPDPVASGGTSTYQITLTNNGNTTATNVVLTQSDFFRQRGRTRLTIESISTPAGFTCQRGPTFFSPPTAEVVCRGTLAAGQTAQFEIVKRQRTPLANGTVIYHEAEVRTDTTEPNTQNNRATDTTTVGQQQNPT